MELRILGPLEAVADDGTQIALGGPRVRAVLARLLVARPAMRGGPSAWLGWLGAIASLTSIATIAFFGMFAWMAWIAVTSIVLLVARRP